MNKKPLFILIIACFVFQFGIPQRVFGALGDATVEVLGGGGGGGVVNGSGGGGGGGGEYRRCTETLSVQSYTVTVGVGGTADTNNKTDSTFSGTGITMTAVGGSGTSDATGGVGGSLGSSTGCDTAVASYIGGAGRLGSTNGDVGGGGGGGAGYAGKGGLGGYPTDFGVGGGGGGGGGESGAGGDAGTAPGAGAAGSGGGGAGGVGVTTTYGATSNGAAGTPATYHIVGGGGGGGGDNGTRGGACGAPGGGSGGGEIAGAGNGCRGEIRIIYVDSEVDATGGTQTTSGIYRIHTFTTSGTFQVTAIPPNTAPTVSTVAASGVTPLGATLNGNITNTGGVDPTVRGFHWALSEKDFETMSYHTTTETGTFSTGTFSQALGGLIAGTTYYFRAYATNTEGTGLGSILNFTAGTDTTPTRMLRLFEGFKLQLNEGRIILYQNVKSE